MPMEPVGMARETGTAEENVCRIVSRKNEKKIQPAVLQSMRALLGSAYHISLPYSTKIPAVSVLA